MAGKTWESCIFHLPSFCQQGPWEIEAILREISTGRSETEMRGADHAMVAQASKPAVSRVSKSATGGTFFAATNGRRSADWEVGETAGWETCAPNFRRLISDFRLDWTLASSCCRCEPGTARAPPETERCWAAAILDMDQSGMPDEVTRPTRGRLRERVGRGPSPGGLWQNHNELAGGPDYFANVLINSSACARSGGGM